LSEIVKKIKQAYVNALTNVLKLLMKEEDRRKETEKEKISVQVEWAKENNLPYKVYSCGHVAVASNSSIIIPEKCPWCEMGIE